MDYEDDGCNKEAEINIQFNAWLIDLLGEGHALHSYQMTQNHFDAAKIKYRP